MISKSLIVTSAPPTMFAQSVKPGSSYKTEIAMLVGLYPKGKDAQIVTLTGEVTKTALTETGVIFNVIAIAAKILISSIATDARNAILRQTMGQDVLNALLLTVQRLKLAISLKQVLILTKL